MTRATLLASLTIALLTAGCDKPKAAPGPSLVIVDDLKQRHALAGPARRIVSLSPALTEVLFAIGCGESVVLRDAWSDYPRAARAVPHIDGLKPSAEAVLSARPGAVVASFPPASLRSALRRAAVPVLAFNPTDLAGVASSFTRLGALCGKVSAGQQLAADFRAELAAVRSKIAGQPKRRVFFELDAAQSGQVYTMGKGAFGHELLEAAGGHNVFAEGPSAWFQVSLEAVLAAAPDVILLADTPTQSRRHDPASLAARPGWSSLTAVKSGRVHAVLADWVSRPGPRLTLGLRQVAGLLHPRAMGLPTAATGTGSR